MIYDQKIEATLLELGAEIYRLKQEVFELKEQNEKILSVIDGVKEIFDEKGLISSEDFEDAAQLGEALSLVKSKFDISNDTEIDKYKKSSH